MPYVRCPHCGITTYNAVPWSQPVDCPSCGGPLVVPRERSVEARVRDILYPQAVTVERVVRRRKPPPEAPGG